MNPTLIFILVMLAVIGFFLLLARWIMKGRRKNLDTNDPVWESRQASTLDEEEETFIADYYDEMRYKRKQIQ
jgi:hypothetical protein